MDISTLKSNQELKKDARPVQDKYKASELDNEKSSKMDHTESSFPNYLIKAEILEDKNLKLESISNANTL